MQKARLIKFGQNGELQPGSAIEVHFNPASLRASYSLSGQVGRSQRSPQGSGSSGERETATVASNQETGFRGSLDVELLFDTTENGANVQEKTRQILVLLHAQAAESDNNAEEGTFVPFVRFQCGTFIFDGRLNSFNETLDYFSAEGKPLRSTVNLSLTAASPYRIADAPGGSGSGASAAAGFSAAMSASASAQISASGSLSGSIGGSASASFGASAGASFGASAGASFGASASASANFSASAGGSVGTSSLTVAQGGESIQSIAASAGVNWRVAASVNGIDNPRKVQAGTVLNLRTR